MSFRSKRELLAQVAPRYQMASRTQKSVILDEFVAATHYARKYAIRLLTRPPLPARSQIRRPRAPQYGAAVQAALEVAWGAANLISARRLVPFLPTLVPVLEQHGHLHLIDAVRTQLLAISPATADRLLHQARKAGQPRGRSITKAGTLLKHQIPIRTFADWDAATPGFVEADLVAHCGDGTYGTFLSALIVTDVATGWVECQALLYRSGDQVIQGITRARQLIPFPLLGIDTDNDSEFITNELISYCAEAAISFTRGRAYHKNDQCYVEQKNGAVVRQFVGYGRFEGEQAYHQLIELYRALRLYVNFFQPTANTISRAVGERNSGNTRPVSCPVVASRNSNPNSDMRPQQGIAMRSAGRSMSTGVMRTSRVASTKPVIASMNARWLRPRRVLPPM